MATMIVQQAQPTEWSSGLCACFDDCGICVLTYCLPCLTYGNNVSATYNGAKGCCGPCCCFTTVWMLIGCPCLVSYNNRREIRQKYNIKEEPCSDCCVHFWCLLCALCQEARELKKRPAGVPWPPTQQQIVMVAAPQQMQTTL